MAGFRGDVLSCLSLSWEYVFFRPLSLSTALGISYPFSNLCVPKGVELLPEVKAMPLKLFRYSRVKGCFQCIRFTEEKLELSEAEQTTEERLRFPTSKACDHFGISVNSNTFHALHTT